MSLVDSTFGDKPGPLLKKWGRIVTFHKTGTTATYDPTSGAVRSTATKYTLHALVTRVQANEVNGTLQSTDYKIIVAPEDINNLPITTSDHFTITRGSRTLTAKVVDVMTIEGDNPILLVAFARPQ